MNRALCLLVVTDMRRSRRFYEDLLGQKVIRDYGANIEFESGFALQTKQTWIDFIGTSHITFGSNSTELYFDCEDFEAFMQRLGAFKTATLVHAPKEYAWGQRVVRLLDPDGHIIEVGQSMRSVVKRYLAGGMSIQEVAEKTQQPIEYVAQIAEV